MTGAPSVRVRDVAVFIKGKKPSITLAAPSGGALPYVLIEGFGGTYKTYTNDPGCVRCRPDDTIVVSDGANTGLASTNHDGYLGSTLGAVRPDPSKVNSRYLFYFVHGNFNMLNTRTRGAAVPHLERDLLLDLEFARPPLPEQERIVRILDEAETLRRLRAQADERTTDLMAALFRRMFERVDSPSVPLSELTSLITSGVTPRGGEEVYVSVGPYFIRSQNVQMNRLDLTNVACLPGEVHEQMNRTRVQPGDVLLNITGASIGRVTWVDQLDREANVSQHVCLIRPQPNLVHPIYLSVLISLPSTQHLILQVQAGASRQALNHQQVRALDIPLPPVSLQNQFAARVVEIRALETAQAASRKQLDDLFQALLHRAFRGEL